MMCNQTIYAMDEYEPNPALAMALGKGAQKVTTDEVFELFGGENELSRKILDSHDLAISLPNEDGKVLLFCLEEGCGEYTVVKPVK